MFVVYLGVRRSDCFALWLVSIAFCGWVGCYFWTALCYYFSWLLVNSVDLFASLY